MDNVIDNLFKPKDASVKIPEVGFVIIRTSPNGETEGANELQDMLLKGFEPFSVTSYMEQREAPKLAGGKPTIQMCDKIWLKRTTVLEPKSAPLPDTHNPS